MHCQSQKACEGQQSRPSLSVGSPIPSAPLLLIVLSWKILVFTWIYSAYHSLKASEIQEVFDMLPLYVLKVTPISKERVSGCLEVLLNREMW